MKVIVHIGDGKCGSSSIQSSLYGSKDHLLNNGVLYHSPRSKNGHFCYITLLGGKTRGDDDAQYNLAKLNIAETREILRSSTPEFLIISGESLFTVRPQDILKLIEVVIGAQATELHVVAYLREPVAHYLSIVQQTIKASHTFPSPFEYRRDTASTFRRWKAEVRCSSLVARLFDRKRMTGGSAVIDFEWYLRKVTGKRDISLLDQNSNVSLSAEQTVVLQVLRRDFFKNLNDRHLPPSNSLIAFFERLNGSFGLVGTKALLKASVQACILENNMSYMFALDSMFPDLGIVGAAECSLSAGGEGDIELTEDVASILRPFDPVVLKNLFELIPEYNSSLRAGNVISAIAALSALKLPPQSDVVFRDYLKRSKLTEAVRSIDSSGPRKIL